MKTAIIGSGAMGSLFGGKLSRQGVEVVLYDINEKHIQEIKEKGLVIEESATGERDTFKPGASTDPASVKGADYFIIFVKSTATEAVAKQFLPFAGPETVVITLQNGVGNEEIIRSVFGEKRSAAGVTSQGATFLGPGAIRHAGNGPTYLCMSDKNNAKLKPLVEKLNDSCFEAHIEENIQNLIWSKLIINVGINALTALTGLPNGQLLDYQETKALMADLVSEALEVVKAKGIQLTYSDPLKTVMEVAEKTGKNRSSMLQDFDRKSPSEIDFINYAIVKEAEKLNLLVPVNLAVARLVKALDNIHLKERNNNA